MATTLTIVYGYFIIALIVFIVAYIITYKEYKKGIAELIKEDKDEYAMITFIKENYPWSYQTFLNVLAVSLLWLVALLIVIKDYFEHKIHTEPDYKKVIDEERKRYINKHPEEFL